VHRVCVALRTSQQWFLIDNSVSVNAADRLRLLERAEEFLLPPKLLQHAIRRVVVSLNIDRAALGRIALDMQDLRREVHSACAPYLKAVDPRVGLRRREQGHVLAQTGDGAPRPWESDTIGVE
jgi:hypothetical protein